MVEGDGFEPSKAVPADLQSAPFVDSLQTSDSYILERMEDNEVYALHSRQKPTLAEKLGLAQAAEATLSMAVDKLPDALARFELNSRLNILK